MLTIARATVRAQWIMYDLGAEHDLRALRLTTYKFGVPPPTPPPPPPPPAPEEPPPSPTEPPAPPVPPSAPPPPFPFVCIGSVGTADCYDKLVLRANNGVCEDGAEGSTSDVCAWGYAKMQAEPRTHTFTHSHIYALATPKRSPACLSLRVRNKIEPTGPTARTAATRAATGTRCRARTWCRAAARTTPSA